MNDDLMTRAQNALAKEEEARLLAKMRELEAADRVAETEAERTARQGRARAEAAEIMAQAPRSMVTDQFDAAVSALGALVEAIYVRNDAIKRSNNVLRAARCYEASAGNEAVSVNGEIHSAAEAPVHVMVARVAQAVAAKFRDGDNHLQQLASTLNGHAGPLSRLTGIGR
ncbi:hypothetical protein ACIGW0_00505 [Streptomyces bikiniensis]|uniref:Uncharacterized protein n=1 Tax=Streptomyces bikiniensis TaxID=1896 RepID=A0ABW8CM03_STRBI